MKNQMASEDRSWAERRAEKRAYRRARTAAGMRISFYFHFMAYAVTMLLLLAVNYLLSPGVWWVMVPAAAWGIALAIHGLSVLLFPGPQPRTTSTKDESGKAPAARKHVDEEARGETALASVAAGVRKGFYHHLAVYVAVNLLLLVISLKLTPGFFWVMWMAMGWGIGIIVHGLSALFLASPLAQKKTE